jgi:hypothetical protein
MIMKKILLAVVSFLLVSCEDNYKGDSGWFLILLIGLIVIFIILGRNANKQKAKNKDRIITKYNLSNLIKTDASYVGGHPMRDTMIPDLYCALSDNKLRFYSLGGSKVGPGLVFSIPKDAIQNIELEDASSIEHKVTLGRIILVGVFALAWKKKEKNELAFVIIKWNDGKFDHSTIFSCEGQNAMQKANTLRNLFIRLAQ